ncbi:MAG: YfhO family protein [bacterium]|nr:YfhO family protein [bacterium]
MKLSQINRKGEILILLFAVVLLFFYKLILFGQIPFPGDLLVGQYNPYSTYPFMGYNPGSYPNKAQDFDVLTMIFPAKEFSISSLKNWQFPLWNPYILSGNPHLAAVQSGTFYPFNLLFFVMPIIYAWSLYIMLQPILTGLFTYLFLRELKFGTKSSLFGSLIFTFSSYSVVWMEYGNIGHTIVWLPLILYLILKLVKERSLLFYLLTIASLTLSILAGYIQLAFYIFIFSFIFLLFILYASKERSLKLILYFIPVFILPVLISAIQLAPFIEMFLNSTRAPHADFFKLLIPPFHLITMFIPDFFGNPASRNYWLDGTYIERVSYIGVIPLFFIIYSFFRKKNKYFWFFLSSAISVLLLSFDNFVSRFIFSLNLPLISTAVPTRIIFLFCFAGAVLAANGLEEFERKKEMKKSVVSLIILALIYFFAWGFVFVAPIFFSDQAFAINLSISKRNLILPSLLFLSGAMFVLLNFVPKFRKVSLILVFLLVVFDLFYFFQKITPFAPVQSFFPKTEVIGKLREIRGIDRFWGYGGAYIEPNISTFERLYSTDGYDPLINKRYAELITTISDGSIKNVQRSNVNIPGFGNEDIGKSVFRQKILDLLGVRYILNKISPSNTLVPNYISFPENRFSLKWQSGPWQIYESKEALPRIFLASDYVVRKNDQIIDAIFDQNINLSKTVILEENPVDFKPSDGPSEIKIKNYSPNKIDIFTKSTQNKLLFISDNYFEGWNVFIDGKKSKIYRANYTFRAVPVLAGDHNVVFEYKPRSFYYGLYISGATIALLSFCYIVVKMRHGK